MLYREIIAVYSEIHTKYINILYGQNVGFFNIKLGGTYSDHWVVYSYLSFLNQYMSYTPGCTVCF